MENIWIKKKYFLHAKMCCAPGMKSGTSLCGVGLAIKRFQKHMAGRHIIKRFGNFFDVFLFHSWHCRYCRHSHHQQAVLFDIQEKTEKYINLHTYSISSCALLPSFLNFFQFYSVSHLILKHEHLMAHI